MRNRGVRHPERNALLAAALVIGAAVSIGWGVQRMNALGHETGATGMSIGLGLLVLILGSAFLVNFLWACRIFRGLRSGRTAIARWTLSPLEFAKFRDVDQRFSERGDPNDYDLPRSVPTQGFEVIFSEDGVLIGDCYFGLATTGLHRFKSVAMINSDPPMIEFATKMTAATNLSAVRFFDVGGTLRVPVAADARQRGEMVAQRFRDVVDRRIIVNPHFWSTRIRIGLVAFALGAGFAAIGMALADRNEEFGDIPAGLAAFGTIFALAGLVLAFLAWALRRKQHLRS